MDKSMQLTINSPGEHLIRVGEAIKLQPPKPLRITGKLSAPIDFMDKKDKTKQYDAHYAHMLIDKQGNKLTLHLNEKSPDSEDVITGILEENPELTMWEINTEKRWNVRELIAFVRARKIHFDAAADADGLIESLQKWTAKVERTIKDINNDTGNSLLQLETTVSGIELKRKFKLALPIYKGYGREVFTVEIGFEPKSTSVDLYLFSSDLYELKETSREKIFESCLKRFLGLGFDCSIISVS